MKLVEQRSGTGVLMRDGEYLRDVTYSITRYQGFVEQSGLPIPGLHRLEGSIDFEDYFVVPAKKGCQLVVLLDGSTDYWAGCAIRRRACPSVAASRDDDPEGKACSNDVIWKAPSCKHPR